MFLIISTSYNLWTRFRNMCKTLKNYTGRIERCTQDAIFTCSMGQKWIKIGQMHGKLWFNNVISIPRTIKHVEPRRAQFHPMFLKNLNFPVEKRPRNRPACPQFSALGVYVYCGASKPNGIASKCMYMCIYICMIIYIYMCMYIMYSRHTMYNI